jgi:phage terminase large subunit
MTITPNLLPKQREAFRYLLDENTTEILYGGSVGSGKSYVGCMWVTIMCLKYPKTRYLIGRSKLTQLKLTTLKTLFEVMEGLSLQEGEHYTFNGQSNVLTFYNGSEVIMKDLEHRPSDSNFDSLGSLELTGAFIDETSQIVFKAFQVIKSRLRYKLNEYKLKGKVFMSCNPSQNWLYDYFYKPFSKGELMDYQMFIPALPQDNPYLPESYIEELKKLPEQQRKRLFEGNWDYDSSIDQLFSYSDVNMCFDNNLQGGNKYITADIASYGEDETVIVLWDGLNIVSIERLRHQSIPDISERIKSLKIDYNVPLTNIIVDADGLGIGVKDILKCKGFQNNTKPLQKGNYNNLKSQCYFTLSEYIKDGKINLGTHRQELREQIGKELVAHKIKDVDRDGKNQVIPKEQVKQQIGKSPDISDAIMMRMFYEIKPKGTPLIMGSLTGFR